MSLDGNKLVARRFYDDLVNDRNLMIAEEIFAPDYIDHNVPQGYPHTLDGFKRFFTMLGAAFPDLEVRIEDMVAEEDRVCVRLTIQGTHKGLLLGRIAPTDRRATWTGIDVLRVAGGRISERWGERDVLGLLTQLGAGLPHAESRA